MKSDDLRTWNPPEPPSVPQGAPFMTGDDVDIQFVHEHPGTGPSFLRGWVSRSKRNEAEIELPKAYGPAATAKIVSALDTDGA